MTFKEKAKFKALFMKYCSDEINKGNCGENDCRMCTINDAYELVCNSSTDEDD